MNKQSIELDLSSQEGKQVIYDMVKEADVVLENFKSGPLTDWDLDTKN